MTLATALLLWLSGALPLTLCALLYACARWTALERPHVIHAGYWPIQRSADRG